MPSAAVSQRTVTAETASTHVDDVRAAFDRQKAAYLYGPVPDYEARMASLRKLLAAVTKNKDAIVEAMSTDFGHRSRHESLLADIFPIVSHLRYTMRHLRGWMKPRRRSVEVTFKPGKARVLPQPKGVVGIISPWNYPVQLAITPLASALAAGNRVLLKPSELTPATSELMAKMISETFDPDHVHVVTGGPEVGEAFTKLPLDHLLFTGSTRLGRIVMRAASENLTPVTLELGGKSPALVHPEYPLEKAAQRIAVGKLLNAGQTCVAPDYLLVPEDKADAMEQALRVEIGRGYPTLADNPDYTSIVNERHYARLKHLLEDAARQGAKLVEINPADETLDEASRKLAPTLVRDVREDMAIMQEEIFGPVLPMVTYRDVDEAVRYVNEHPRPLAFYYFDSDRGRAKDVLEKTVSGGACVNETVLHVVQDDLPFGGVGPSGMGAYHGEEGFETFSHMKAVFYQSRLNAAGLLAPPYGERVDKVLKMLIG